MRLWMYLNKEYFSKIKFDTYVTLLTFTILLFGFAMFFSASLGVMARYEIKFYSTVQNQFFFGLLVGSLAYILGAFLPAKFFKNLSPIFFVTGVLLCLLVFVPGLGFEHGGAKRWITLFSITFQPSEVLKYSSVLVLASFYSFFHDQFNNWKYRILPALVVASFVFLILKEPDLVHLLLSLQVFSVYSLSPMQN
jgi:cell division protein FtsW